MRAAHRSLIDCTPTNSLNSSSKPQDSHLQSQRTSSSSKSKLKRAQTAVKEPRAKTPLKRYGTDTKRDIFYFDGDSDEGASGEPGQWLDQRLLGSNRTLSSGDAVALESTGPLQARIINGIEHAKKIIDMPPPASKSSSFEQTQVSESYSITQSQKVESNKKSVKLKPTDKTGLVSSDYSEGRMPTPMMSSCESDDRQHVRKFGSVQQEPGSHRDSDDPSRLYDAEQRSRGCESSSRKSASHGYRDQAVENLTDQNDPASDKVLGRLPQDHLQDQVCSDGRLPKSFQCLETTDELSLPTHGPETWSANQTSLSETKKRKRESDQTRVDEADSDDVAVGLPKDQYEPRPSRSRSGRSTGEVIIPDDFSKRPETIAKKKKLLKSKTTTFQEFSSENRGEIGNAPLNPQTEVSEVVPQTLISELSSTPGLDKSERFDGNDMEEGKLTSKPPEKSEKTNKKQRGRPKKPAPSTALGEDPRNQLEPGSGLSIDHEDRETAKSGASGRKTKKAASAKPEEAALSAELVQGSGDELGDSEKTIHMHEKTLGEISVNQKVSKATGKSAESTSPKKCLDEPPQTPRKDDPPKHKDSDKHSPISSGKVGYRVGLSKRARIAPLLRVVRKT